ncbi:DUF2249 domain-containing protein [Ensifer sp. 1H6]|uniref:DUF2249 domain-containing protein n=1 Tax=Ensifer sp. 1H6 TaxID=1911585 RepID=UPI0009C73341|nr:DUF2249 domain-containing protein [Ensifer sp. 1H6]OMQ46379.1 aminotransferase [Ensifer sp. 1H6]
MTTAETETKHFIDVRTIPPVERHPKIFGMLNALAEGGSFIIVNDHDPRPLHYQLESRYPGEFTWDYLEQGPDVWRVEIGRQQASGCDCCCGSSSGH